MTTAMAQVAAIETKGAQGAFFSRREVPFHKLGTVVPDDVTSPDKVLRLAHLNDWDVRHLPLEELLFGDMNVVKGHRLVVRNNPFYGEDLDVDVPRMDVLGVVRGRHQILQNEELFEFAEALLKGGRIETAGSLNGGTRVFVAMALDSEIVIDEKGVSEHIHSYLVLSNSHDGSAALTAAVTNIRPVCINTLDYAIKNATQKFVIRHTKSMDDRMREAEKTLQLVTNYNERFAEDAKALYEQPVSDKELLKFIDRYIPLPDKDSSERAKTNFMMNYEVIEAIWNSPTVEGAGIKNTRYGVLQTLNEHNIWYRRVLKDREENFWSSAAGFDEPSWKERNRIHELVLQP